MDTKSTQTTLDLEKCLSCAKNAEEEELIRWMVEDAKKWREIENRAPDPNSEVQKEMERIYQEMKRNGEL